MNKKNTTISSFWDFLSKISLNFISISISLYIIFFLWKQFWTFDKNFCFDAGMAFYCIIVIYCCELDMQLA